MTKQELRRHIKTLIPQEEVRKAESERICKIIIQSKEYKTAPLVLLYMALDDEVSLSLVIDNALDSKKTIGLPRIRPQSSLMDFYKVTDHTQLQAESKYGIKEPEPCKEDLINPNALPDGTLIIVPGRAFTKDGLRLGRGKGFYDLWLSKIPSDKKNRVHLCGVCFPQQIVEGIPCDEHDIKMDGVFF